MTYQQYNVYAIHTDVVVADLGIRITMGNPLVLSGEDFQSSNDLKHLISVGAVAYRLREVAMKPKNPPPAKVVQPPHIRDPNIAWIRKPGSTPVFKPSNSAPEPPSSLVDDLAALREQQEVLQGYLISQQKAQQGQMDAHRQMREDLQRQHQEILALMAENQQAAIANALAVAALQPGQLAAPGTWGGHDDAPNASGPSPRKEAVFIPSRITPEGESADVSNLTVQETQTTADVSSAQKALKKARSQKKVEDHGDD